jgi:hypothetical protein
MKTEWVYNHAFSDQINHLNTKLNTICHLLALLGAHHILHVSRIRVTHPKIYCSEASKEGLGSERTVVPMMMMKMYCCDFFISSVRNLLAELRYTRYATG